MPKVLLWAEVAYRLSTGDGITPTDALDAIPVSSLGAAPLVPVEQLLRPADRTRRDRPDQHPAHEGHSLPRTSTSNGARSAHCCTSFRTRMPAATPAERSSTPKISPGRRDDDVFLPGKWGRYGAVENFHCYRDQDEDLHTRYDRPPKGTVLRPEFPESFNPLLGARDAIDASADYSRCGITRRPGMPPTARGTISRAQFSSWPRMPHLPITLSGPLRSFTKASERPGRRFVGRWVAGSQKLVAMADFARTTARARPIASARRATDRGDGPRPGSDRKLQ